MRGHLANEGEAPIHKKVTTNDGFGDNYLGHNPFSSGYEAEEDDQHVDKHDDGDEGDDLLKAGILDAPPNLHFWDDKDDFIDNNGRNSPVSCFTRFFIVIVYRW